MEFFKFVDDDRFHPISGHKGLGDIPSYLCLSMTLSGRSVRFRKMAFICFSWPNLKLVFNGSMVAQSNKRRYSQCQRWYVSVLSAERAAPNRHILLHL